VGQEGQEGQECLDPTHFLPEYGRTELPNIRIISSQASQLFASTLSVDSLEAEALSYLCLLLESHQHNAEVSSKRPVFRFQK